MGFVKKAVKSVFKAVGKVVGFVVKAAGAVFGFGTKKPKATSEVSNLNKTLDPEANRKIVFGKIAAALDVRFWEVWGTDADKFDEVIALAGHQIHSVQEFYAEDKLAISSAGSVQSRYSGVLTRSYNLGAPGQSALSVGGGVLWTSASKFTGSAHMKLAWVMDEKKLPNGAPSRYTQVCEGALVYDPRRDSTQPGGSGTHRINDQTTWAYATLDGNGVQIGRNNALQALWYLLGWKITNPVTAEPMLVCGRGIDPEDINIASFIAGANACETAGYYTDMLLSTGDDHSANEAKITCDGLIGRLLDPGGLWSYYANVNDTASIAVDLTDDDIILGGSVSWNEYRGMSDQFNQVAGKFINPNVNVLYQQYPYQTVRDATYETNLGVKKRRTKDFTQVLDNTLAQRLARLFLNMGQYQGEFKARFNFRAIKAQGWSVVRYTSTRFGWTKLFRVHRHEINVYQGISLTLKEIHSSIWGAGTVDAAMSPGAGSNYDPLSQYAVLGLTAANVSITGAGTYPVIQDGIKVSWTAPPNKIAQTEVRFKVTTAADYQYLPPIIRTPASPVTAQVVLPVIKGTNYRVEARHITIYGVEGPWAVITSITAGVTGNVVTANAPVLGSIDPVTGRIINPEMYNTQNILSINSTTNIAVTYTVGGSNVTVNIPSHTRIIASTTGPKTLTYGAGSFVVPFSSYWIAYIDDANLTGFASPAYQYTTNPNNLLYPNRYFVASGTSPASGGGGGSSGGGGGGGGYGDNCVAADSYMPNGITAEQVQAGDLVCILNETWDGMAEGRVTNNSLAEAECVELESSSGIKLVLSADTPCTLFGGQCIAAKNTEGYMLAVYNKYGFRWEEIVSAKNVGKRKVAHISCEEGTYAAGAIAGEFIFTHNWTAKP